MNDINIDRDRLRRCGHPESVYSPGKRPDQIVRALRTLHASDGVALATRCGAELASEVREEDPEIIYEPHSRTLRLGSALPRKSEKVTVIVTAGTSDLPMAEEAAVTLETYGYLVNRINDVGVAGIDRLFGRLEEIRQGDVVIVVAGMEGALASVVGGLVSTPVIGVPTSTGYGVAEGGGTALQSMLSSCAAGVLVTNIDNGFGAAIAAVRILGVEQHDELE